MKPSTPLPLNERDGLLKENWYIACLSIELKKKPLRIFIYDQAYVLFRNDQGLATCLLDRCLHRHAQLSLGHINPQGCLVCPYHGWTYNSQGELCDVPSEGPQQSSHRHKTPPIPLVEQDEVIWIWLGTSPPLTDPTFRFPFFKERGWEHYFMITDFENEVTHLAENFMDVPHTVFVHAGWFRNKSFRQVPIDVATQNGQVLVTYHQKADQIGFMEWVLNPNKEPMTHTDCFIMPNITKVDYHYGSSTSFLIISQCTPVSTLKTRVTTAIIFRLGKLNKVLKPFLKYYTRQVIQQDVEIMANQGANFKVDFNCKFHGTDADVVHSAIEKLRYLGTKDSSSWKAVNENTSKDIWI